MKKYYLTIAVVACSLGNCSSQKIHDTTKNLKASEAQNQTTMQNVQSTQTQNTQQQKDLNLENTKWFLKTVDGKEMKGGFTAAYIIFSDDRISGNSGCNGFSGTYYLSGSFLKFDDIMSTMRGCAGENPEKSFFSALNRTDACMIIGSKLILMQMGSEIATFEAGIENPAKNIFKLAE